MSIINSKPKPYPETATPEILSVTTFITLLDREKVVPDVKFLDKIPSIDGIIELIDESRYPIGKLEVQIKTLEKKNVDKPKFQCELSFLAYCESSVLPVILVVVDASNRKAYWRHINRSLLLELKDKIKGDTVNVNLPKENCIEENTHEYFDCWTRISSDYKRRIIDYDAMRKELEENVSKIDALSKHYHPNIGAKNEYFKSIHMLLDTYNSLLDGPFYLIKNLYGKDIWKFGIVYSKFSDKSISYSLYPIYSNSNDAQIYCVNDKNELKNKGWNFIKGMYGVNEVYQRPVEYSYTLISETISELLKKKAFYFYNNIIAREFIYAFIDRYSNILPLIHDINCISVKEIKHSLIDFVQFLAFRTADIVKANGIEIMVCDLDALLIYGNKADINAIKSEFNSINESTVFNRPVVINSQYFDYKYLTYLIERLSDDSVENIVRIHPKHQIPAKNSYHESEVYDSVNLKVVFETIHKNIPDLFYNFVIEYFPELAHDMGIFKSLNRIVYVLDAGNKGVKTFCLQNTSNSQEKRIDVYHRELDDIPSPFNTSGFIRERIVKSDDSIYKLVSQSDSVFMVEYKRLPVLNYLYKKLGESFYEYFSSKGVKLSINSFKIDYI